MLLACVFVTRYQAAQQQWSKVSFTERRAVLMDINDWVLEHQEEVPHSRCMTSAHRMS